MARVATETQQNAISIGFVHMIYYALFFSVLDKAGDLCSILHIK